MMRLCLGAKAWPKGQKMGQERGKNPRGRAQIPGANFSLAPAARTSRHAHQQLGAAHAHRARSFP